LSAATPNAHDLTRVLIPYRVPSLARSIIELAITVGPLVLLWFLMWATLEFGSWLYLLLAAPAAGFLVRLFMIQHDCGHGAFFHRRSPPILGFTTSIICAVESPVTDCRSYCATTRTSRALAGLPCLRVSSVCGSCCGTRASSVSSLSAKCVSSVLRFEGGLAHRRCVAPGK
jgi:hypothetical protein